MKYNALLIVALLLLQSGCGHLPNITPDLSKVLRKPDVENNEQTPEKEENSSQTGGPLDTVAHDSNNDSTTTDESSDDLNVEPTQSIETEVETDLLVRIRNGFSLPELDSKFVRQKERWSANHPTYINNLFARAEPFLFYIVEEIEKRGLPMELALLPAIESAYKTNAVSRSNAAGLWQFIPSTGRHFGLRQDYWHDGRRDLIAATQAALTYLTELNQLFDGDWFLTLAAYNAGQGTVMKAINKNQRANRPTDYLSLDLRLETQRYVPKLIALRNLVNNPSNYNVTLPVIANQATITSINLPGQIDLKQFARDASINYASLKNLNGAHKRWATSPTGPHRLIVRTRDLERATRVSAQLVNAPKLNYRQHLIKRGESLSTIASKYGVTVNAIKVSNKLRNNTIREGKHLVIPVRGLTNTHAIASVEHSDKSDGSRKVIHRVQKGDTLWSIAQRYQVKLQELLNWNQLSSKQILSLDQQLLVFLN